MPTILLWQPHITTRIILRPSFWGFAVERCDTERVSRLQCGHILLMSVAVLCRILRLLRNFDKHLCFLYCDFCTLAAETTVAPMFVMFSLKLKLCANLKLCSGYNKLSVMNAFCGGNI